MHTYLHTYIHTLNIFITSCFDQKRSSSGLLYKILKINIKMFIRILKRVCCNNIVVCVVITVPFLTFFLAPLKLQLMM